MKQTIITLVTVVTILALSLLSACLPQETAGNPYYVQVVGLVTDNGTMYTAVGPNRIDAATQTVFTGILIGNGATVSYVALPAGLVVGTSASQELTNKTLTSAVANGTWTSSSGWTIPDITLGDAINANGKNIYNVNLLTFGGGTYQEIYIPTPSGSTDNKSLRFIGGSNHGDVTNSAAASLDLFGAASAGAGSITFHTPRADGAAIIPRLEITGKTTTALATWTDTNQNLKGAYVEYLERSGPGAGPANTVRVYAADNATMTNLNAVFQDGTIVMIASQGTPLDAPQFRYADNTELRLVVKKPHPGLAQYGYQYPDGTFQLIRQLEYHDADKIAANKGAIRPLPAGWVVTTLAQRVADRLAVIDSLMASANETRVIAELQSQRVAELARTE